MNLNKLRHKYAKKALKKPQGEFEPVLLSEYESVPTGCTRAYKNNRYSVLIYDKTVMRVGIGPATFLATMAMIQRHDDKPIPNHWAVMQDIKNKIFGKHKTGIEYYPSTDKLINVHNIYWLFILPEEELPVYVGTHTG